jgi:peroxiredoxin Q/BCP
VTKLDAGAKAPAFTLKDTDGKSVSLKDFAGRKVVVYFYPRDDTPGCTKEACQFTSLFGLKEAPVIGISADSQASHAKFRDKYKLSVTLLSDPDRKVMEAYGAYGEKMMYGKKTVGVIRSTFIVDEKGKIARAWYSVKADGHAAKVLEALKGGTS